VSQIKTAKETKCDYAKDKTSRISPIHPEKQYRPEEYQFRTFGKDGKVWRSRERTRIDKMGCRFRTKNEGRSQKFEYNEQGK
jgi:hypothetical protein